MRLFNKYDNGSEEIVSAVGLISNGISFDKWEAIIPLGVRDLKAIIGPEPIEGLSELYELDVIDCEGERLVGLAQKSVAFFTWLKIIPTLDAQHDEGGRSRRLGENEKGLTALQEFKDEENIRHLAYEATDALIEAMEASKFRPWLESRKYRQREGLVIRSKEVFDEFYNIGSHRLFVTLLPIIREVQGSQIAAVLGRKHLADVLAEDDSSPLYESAARALALLTMKKAVERLPVEVIPEGVVQVQQSQPIKQRLKAEQQARAAVAASLGDDAARCLDNLQAMVAAIDAESAEFDDTLSGPLVHSRGMSF